MLAEHEGRVELAELRDHVLNADPRGRGLPGAERLRRERVVLALGEAGDVEDLRDGPRGPVQR